MGKATSVDEYIQGLPDSLKEVAGHARAAIDQGLPEATAVMWHGHPVWTATPESPGKAPVALLKGYTSHVTFGLWRGQELADPAGLLEPGSRGMANLKLRSTGDIDAAPIAEWLASAWQLEQAASAESS